MKPKLRRSDLIERLLENDSQSLVGSSNLYDSICDSHRTLHVDVSTAADDDDDDFSSVGSISALFSVDNQSMPSDDCSFNYSLCSDSFSTRARGPSSQALFIFRQFFDKDSGTINTLDFDYNNCAMLRHAGLDYKSRTLPNDAISTSSIKAAIAFHHYIPHQSLQRTHKFSWEDDHITKDFGDAIAVTTSCQQIGKTFDSKNDARPKACCATTQVSTYDMMVKLVPHNGVIADKRKGHRVRKWLWRSKPASALIRSTSPAA